MSGRTFTSTGTVAKITPAGGYPQRVQIWIAAERADEIGEKAFMGTILTEKDAALFHYGKRCRITLEILEEEIPQMFPQEPEEPTRIADPKAGDVICGNTRAGAVCTNRKGHQGTHIARGPGGHVLKEWPQ